MTTSLYIHWPFCESKCPYCDFNSHVREKVEHDRWQAAYLKEIQFYAEKGKEEISSIFFGGGTPSLMKPEMVAAMLEKIKKEFSVADDIEITLEANPSSYETEKFKNFKQAGINRVSIGIQSFDENILKFLGRKHDRTQAINAIESAGNIFGNFSFDLIYATPNQTLESWNRELEFALQFGSPHISLYQLTIEKGTPFFSDYNNKKFVLPEQELQTDLYNLTVEKCKANGLMRYEISNFAKPSFESKHNLNYWLYNEYIGIGPGAHGRILEASQNTSLSLEGRGQISLANEMSLGNLGEGKAARSHPHPNPSPLKGEGKLKIAYFNIHHPENWLEMMGQKDTAIQQKDILSRKEMLEEMIFMGLRIKQGIKLSKFEALGFKFEELFDKKLIGKLCDEGFMVVDDENIRLTDAGLLLHTNIVGRLSKYFSLTA